MFGLDPSIGDSQIKISAAAKAGGKDYATLTREEYQSYRTKLFNTALNIDYLAKYVRYLLDRKNRYLGISSTGLLSDPNAMAVIATEYNRGETDTALVDAKPNKYGFEIVSLLVEGSPLYAIFDTKLNGEDKKIGEYLDSKKGMISKSIEDSSRDYKKRMGKYAAGFGTVIASLGALYWMRSRKNDPPIVKSVSASNQV